MRRGFSSCMVVIVFAGLCGCTDPRAFSTVDPWYRPLGGIEATPAQQIEESRVHQVTAGEEGRAEEMLRTVAFVEVSPEEAGVLVGNPVKSERRLFLVRGLALDDNPRGFRLQVLRDGALVVTHGRLGNRPAPMVRRALVVELEKAPTEVYLEVWMAE